MKKILFAFVMMNSTLSWGQDRVNRIKHTFSSSGETIAATTGWAFNNEAGEWVGYQNLISSDQYKNYPSLKGSRYHKSKCSRNTFESLTFKKLVYSDTTYYVLVVDAVEGSYKYPSIQEDWEDYNTIRGYVFTEAEFKKIKNHQNGKIYFSAGGSRYDYSQGDELLINKIISTFQNRGYLFESGYQMKVTKTDDGKNVRFLLPQRESTYSPVDFKNNYFEMEVEKFNALLNVDLKLDVTKSNIESSPIVSNSTVIKMEEIIHDFGNIAEGKVYSHEFKFTNSGTSPLIIENLTARCSCITPKWSKDPIAPGQTSSVIIDYDTKGRPGFFSKGITLFSNGGLVQLEVKGSVTK